MDRFGEVGSQLAAPPRPEFRHGVAHRAGPAVERDHTDASALAGVLAPGAPVFRPAPGHGDDVDNVATLPSEREPAGHGLVTEVLEPWLRREVGPFRITVVPVHHEPDQPEKVPGYVEVTDPEEQFRAHAGQRAHVLAVGEWLDVGEACGTVAVPLLQAATLHGPAEALHCDGRPLLPGLEPGSRGGHGNQMLGQEAVYSASPFPVGAGQRDPS